MKKEIKTEERLIVAADYSPKECGGIRAVEAKVMELALSLRGTGVIIKVNSILRAVGYGLITQLHKMGLKVFADLKLVDIPATMKIDAELLAQVMPNFVTVMCNAGDGIRVFKETVGPDCEVLGVTVLTSLNDEKCKEIYSCSCEEGVSRFAHIANEAGADGLILSPKEIEIVKRFPGLNLSLNTPGIRPEWSLVENDDQSRVMTPEKAIKNGADRIVIGRPITGAKNPRKAVIWTLNEILKAS